MAQGAAALCAERARERGDAAAAEAVARQMELKQAAERAAFDERADGSEPGIGEVGPNLEDEDVLQRPQVGEQAEDGGREPTIGEH